MVSIRGVSKRFGSVQALDDVSLEVGRGEIHALVGENGAGKTTLMRILYGVLQSDAGSIEVEGKPARFRTARDGIAAGIGMVSQHYSIIGELSCLENLMLGAEPGAVISKTAATVRAQSLAEAMGFVFDWGAEASTLSPGSAQKLEILKLLWRNARIMILDEPTAMLSPADGEALFASLKLLAAQGATVILVTHRLPEVMDHCTRVTVLRGGKRIAALPVAETDAKRLAEMIVGHALDEVPRRKPLAGAQSLLEVRNLTVLGDRGNEAVQAASFDVREGEVLGVAGVDGSGQRELFWALLGALKPISGTITLAGEDLSGESVPGRLERGIRLIPEDRHLEGAVDDWSLDLNAALGQQRMAPIAKGAWIAKAHRRQLAQQIAERFETRYATLDSPMDSLSGGNQQRFVAARALALAPKLILAFQPARGLDIDATRAVYRGLQESCEQGAGAIVVSFDLDELLEHCDRVIVMNRGIVAAPAPDAELDRAAIGQLMVSAA